MDATGRLELLQITLIVRDLPAAEKAFQEKLGLEVAFRDPGVDLWGLENVVLPMGKTFLLTNLDQQKMNPDSLTEPLLTDI